MINRKAFQAKSVLIFLIGMVSALFLLAGYHLLMYLLSSQQKVSCHTPSSVVMTTEYCVYHTERPGLFSNRNTLLIGPADSRGIVYEIPYSAHEVSASWDQTTDVVTIAMPGTKLIIEPDIYVDTR